MSYEPTNWKTGDVVTSTKLNHMEKGIEDNSFDVYVGTPIPDTDSGFQFPLTYNQAVAALQANKTIKLYTAATIGNDPELHWYRVDMVTAAGESMTESDQPEKYYLLYTTQWELFSLDPNGPLSTVYPF